MFNVETVYTYPCCCAEANIKSLEEKLLLNCFDKNVSTVAEL